ncbi:hypothetical protein ACFWZ2_24175 [Streptomyces sp. NPDC059002]|uniref:hypothetical protein n=1 Tax=Streptomyces sp. NPDC059002 TaxID=3346690 RepID=UPI0036B5022F
MAGYEASQTPSSSPEPTPVPLTSAWLTAHFAPLPFPARMTALARYGRTLTPAAYATLHHTLDAGDEGERHTALFLAVARRDLPTISHALTDPLLRRRALSAAIRLPVPEQALERLALSETRAERHETYRVLRLSGRSALAGRLLPEVYERYGSRDASQLLPACPPATVAAWLARLDPPMGVLNALARTAPLAVVDLLVSRSRSKAGNARYSFTRQSRAVASLAAERDPEAGLVLLEQARELLTDRAARSLLRRPGRVLEILRATPPGPDGELAELGLPAGPLPPSVRRAVRELNLADQQDLARRCPANRPRMRYPERQEVAPDGLLALLPAPERRRLLEERAERLRSVRSLPVTTLAALEPADRAEMVLPWAERWLRRERAVSHLAVALPLASGEPLLREIAGRHRIHHRMLGWPALLACAELEGDPTEFARIAVDCERAWHDQEEVRHRALRQLGGAPPRMLAALPERVLRDAALTTVQSRDSTDRTLAAAEQLLRRTTESAATQGSPERAAYLAQLLCQVVADSRRRGPVAALCLAESEAQSLWASLGQEARTRPGRGVYLAELLAPHLTALPELDALARRTALEHEDPHVAARAAEAWVTPARIREARCAELIGLDASFAAVPLVLRTVASRRTDLLDVVLAAARRGLTGRVRPRAAAWVPNLPQGVTHRWLPGQRKRWDEHHARVALDESAPLCTRADAAARLRDPALITRLADDAPQPVAAAALGALGDVIAANFTDSTELTGVSPAHQPFLDLLLRHAATGGVRGRAAMSSVRHLLEAVPDRRAVGMLAPVARAADVPVGSRKEAARGLGTLTGAAAHDALLAAWDAPHQHRDVRAVLARGLLSAIDRPEVADRLARCGGEPAVREAVIHPGPGPGPVPHSMAEPYRGFLTRLVRQGDADTVRAACQALPGWLAPDSGDAMRAVADVAVDENRTHREWDAAVRQLVRFPTGPVARDILNRAFRQLGDRADTGDPQARADTEAPQGRVDALRRLVVLSAIVRARQGTTVTLQVADALAQTLRRAGLRPQAAHLLWETALVATRLGRYDAQRWQLLIDLLEERPGRLAPASERYLDMRRPHAREALLTAARMLRERGTPVTGALALELVRAGGRESSWDVAWQDELAGLREHEDHDTALAALLVDVETSR